MSANEACSNEWQTKNLNFHCHLYAAAIVVGFGRHCKLIVCTQKPSLPNQTLLTTCLFIHARHIPSSSDNGVCSRSPAPGAWWKVYRKINSHYGRRRIKTRIRFITPLHRASRSRIHFAAVATMVIFPIVDSRLKADDIWMGTTAGNDAVDYKNGKGAKKSEQIFPLC